LSSARWRFIGARPSCVLSSTPSSNPSIAFGRAFRCPCLRACILQAGRASQPQGQARTGPERLQPGPIDTGQPVPGPRSLDWSSGGPAHRTCLRQRPETAGQTGHHIYPHAWAAVRRGRSFQRCPAGDFVKPPQFGDILKELIDQHGRRFHSTPARSFAWNRLLSRCTEQDRKTREIAGEVHG
jgi:hypothetical protein